LHTPTNKDLIENMVAYFSLCCLFCSLAKKSSNTCSSILQNNTI